MERDSKTRIFIGIFCLLSVLFVFMGTKLAFADCSSVVNYHRLNPTHPEEDGIDGPYVDNGNGTVTDLGTGLMWQQIDDGNRYIWREACAYCESLTLGDYNDWELPDVYQLLSLVDRDYDPSINTDYFYHVNSNGHYYFTGSTPSGIVNANNFAYAVWFQNANKGAYVSTNKKYDETSLVRCVRAEFPGDLYPLIVSISADELSGEAPFQVSFSSSVEGINPPYSYEWDFGDRTAIEKDPTEIHVYQNQGVYTVTLTVTDGEGNSKTATETIYVNSQPPQCTMEANVTEGVAPLTVSFISHCYDPEGGPLSYAWDFGDNQSAQSATPSHVYYHPGTYTVTLTATDDMDFEGSSTMTIRVLDENEDPTPVDPDPGTEPDPGNDPEIDCITLTKPDVIMPNTSDEIAESSVAISAAFIPFASMQILNFDINFPCFAEPVDVYVAFATPDGSLVFIKSDGTTTTTAFEPFATGTTGQIESKATFTNVYPAGPYCVYWVIAPSNGGDLLLVDWAGPSVLGAYSSQVDF